MTLPEGAQAAGDATAATGCKLPPAAPEALQAAAGGQALPSSTVEAAVPGTFCADLWGSVDGPGGIFRWVLPSALAACCLGCQAVRCWQAAAESCKA